MIDRQLVFIIPQVKVTPGKAGGLFLSPKLSASSSLNASSSEMSVGQP